MTFSRNTVGCWLLAISCWLCALSAHGQEPTVITRSQMVGIGGSNILDTYISDEHFRGFGASFLSVVDRQRPGRHWSTLVEHEANFSTTRNRARTQHELEGAYNFYWGRLYNWQLLDGRLRLQAGALGNVSAGFIYNTSNSNNPAQARFHINVLPTVVPMMALEWESRHRGAMTPYVGTPDYQGYDYSDYTAYYGKKKK